MRAWSTIYNFFGLLILVFFMLDIHNEVRANEKEFSEMHLQYSVDYATEAAFQASLEGDSLDISYQDLQNVKVNPANVLDDFKTALMMSFDMGMSQTNKDSLDHYIASAVLAVNDGYYIATPQEVNTGEAGVSGSQYALKWGMKKPYTIKYGENDYVAYHLSDDIWVRAKQVNGTMSLINGNSFSSLSTTQGITVTRQKIITAVNRRISDDINYNISLQNELYSGIDKDFIYLPAVQSSSGINPIQKPSLLITLQGVDFSGSQKLDVSSVGGFTIAKKIRVLGFVKDGEKYYAFESQIPDSELSTVQNFYNTVEEAADSGYRPYLDYLKNPLPALN